MSSRSERFFRLHRLRAQMANVALAERRQIEHAIAAAEAGQRSIEDGIAGSLKVCGAPMHTWAEQRAMHAIAKGRLVHLAQARNDLESRAQTAREAEREALVLREQNQRMLMRSVQSEALAASRQLQSQLDETHRMIHVRKSRNYAA